jgi:hypothetical protein
MTTLRSARRGGATLRAEAPGTASSIQRKARPPRASTSSPSTPSASTPSRSTPRFTGTPSPRQPHVGQADASRFRVRGEALSEVHAPDVPRRAGQDTGPPGRRRRVQGGHRTPGGRRAPGPLLAQFPASFKDTPDAAPTSAGCSHLRALHVAVELRHRIVERHGSPTSRGCSTRTARRGCRSTSRNSASQSGRISCRT